MLTPAIEWFLAAAVSVFYWFYSRFWRIEHHREPPRNPAKLYAHWHGDELLLVAAFMRRGMAVMSSHSRDGERMKRMLSWLGYYVVRGSSTRGGAAGLKGLIDAVNKEGREASLAVDGPRGPRYKVKPGILKLAQETQRELVPGATAASRKFVFKKSWNRCYLPFPFSRCVIVYGDPIRISATASEEELEAIRLQLEKTLLILKAEAESLVTASKPSLLSAAASNTGV